MNNNYDITLEEINQAIKMAYPFKRKVDDGYMEVLKILADAGHPLRFSQVVNRCSPGSNGSNVHKKLIRLVSLGLVNKVVFTPPSGWYIWPGYIQKKYIMEQYETKSIPTLKRNYLYVYDSSKICLKLFQKQDKICGYIKKLQTPIDNRTIEIGVTSHLLETNQLSTEEEIK